MSDSPSDSAKFFKQPFKPNLPTTWKGATDIVRDQNGQPISWTFPDGRKGVRRFRPGEMTDTYDIVNGVMVYTGQVEVPDRCGRTRDDPRYEGPRAIDAGYDAPAKAWKPKGEMQEHIMHVIMSLDPKPETIDFADLIVLCVDALPKPARDDRRRQSVIQSIRIMCKDEGCPIYGFNRPKGLEIPLVGRPPMQVPFPLAAIDDC